MNPLTHISKTPSFIQTCFRTTSLKKKLLILFLFIGLAIAAKFTLFSSPKNTVTYLTTPAEKGTLITSISGSGSITSGNTTNITTKVSGIVNKVYVTNGETIAKGQKIADIDLDDYAKERQASAWVTYLEATEAVKDGINAKALADIKMWQDRQTYLTAEDAYKKMKEVNVNPVTGKAYTDGEWAIIEKTYGQSQKAYLTTESKYLNSDADIANARAKVAAALRNYQENTAVIVSPANGVISNLALSPGIVVNASSTTSSTSGATIVSAQTIGKIGNTVGQLIASVSIPEVDIVTIKANQKVTLTLDAFPDKTFTGKVLAINTSGSVSSGVVSYPVTLILDPVSIDIYPNMSVNAEIITNIKNAVISIPTTAITTTDGQSTVQVKKDGLLSTVIVETGISNDMATEVTSGLAEGDEIVTSIINSVSTPATTSTASPFSGIGRTTTRTSGNQSSGSLMIQGEPPGGF